MTTTAVISTCNILAASSPSSHLAAPGRARRLFLWKTCRRARLTDKERKMEVGDPVREIEVLPQTLPIKQPKEKSQPTVKEPAPAKKEPVPA
jgi:hypothetical protein